MQSYEPQVTKTSVSPLQPKLSADDLAKPREFEEEPSENAQVGQAASGEPPRGRGRKSKRKPVISIRVKLDDDLRNLKRTNGKNFDKILSKCSKKSCLLVIEKSKSPKRDEYSLNFVNNVSHSKPYSKLLRKNRTKRKSSVSESIPKDFTKTNHSLSSEFCEENIYPSPKINLTNFAQDNKIFSPYLKEESFLNPLQNQHSNIKIKLDSTELKDIESVKQNNLVTEEKNTTIQKKENNKIALPTHLIPYEEKVLEEKPFRNWPIITRLFDKDNIEIYKNYVNSLSSQKEENEKEEDQKKDDTNEIVPFDISEARAFHKTVTSRQNEEMNEKETPKTETITIETILTEETGIFESSETPFGNETTRKKNLLKLSGDKTLETNFSIKKSIDSPGSFVISEKPCGNDIGSEKLYTSTAYLLLGEANADQNNGTQTNKFESENNATNSESSQNMRLLSLPMKTYKSISKNVDEESFYDCEKGFSENSDQDSIERKRRNSEKKIKGMRKLYFFNIVLALFVIVVLAVILFISFADISTVDGIVANYIKR